VSAAVSRGRALWAGIATALLMAACSGGSGAPADEPASTPSGEAMADPGYITRAEYGDDWPFDVAAGTLRCYDDPLSDRIYVVFDTGDGIEYALNGSARDFGFPELDEAIMPDLPDRSKTLPLIDRGLELCDLPIGAAGGAGLPVTAVRGNMAYSASARKVTSTE
jgi:hypothetical protein